jgi:RNA polymerase sigma-70 factor (ECF subfamily)
MPSEEWYRQIHGRLLAGDPVASTELAEAAWKPLVEKLEKTHPLLKHSDFLRDAASDALISYIKHPTQFDPGKRGLFGFLVMAAEGDLRNALAKTIRRKRREIPLADVELASAGGKERVEAPGTDVRLEAERLRGKIRELFKDPRDREALELLIDGERSTRAFARVWGLEGLPTKEQAREVKRHKDRVKKMLQRYGGSSYGRKG